MQIGQKDSLVTHIIEVVAETIVDGSTASAGVPYLIYLMGRTADCLKGLSASAKVRTQPRVGNLTCMANVFACSKLHLQVSIHTHKCSDSSERTCSDQSWPKMAGCINKQHVIAGEWGAGKASAAYFAGSGRKP